MKGSARHRNTSTETSSAKKKERTGAGEEGGSIEAAWGRPQRQGRRGVMAGGARRRRRSPAPPRRCCAITARSSGRGISITSRSCRAWRTSTTSVAFLLACSFLISCSSITSSLLASQLARKAGSLRIRGKTVIFFEKSNSSNLRVLVTAASFMCNLCISIKVQNSPLIARYCPLLAF